MFFFLFFSIYPSLLLLSAPPLSQSLTAWPSLSRALRPHRLPFLTLDWLGPVGLHCYTWCFIFFEYLHRVATSQARPCQLNALSRKIGGATWSSPYIDPFSLLSHCESLLRSWLTGQNPKPTIHSNKQKQTKTSKKPQMCSTAEGSLEEGRARITKFCA